MVPASRSEDLHKNGTDCLPCLSKDCAVNGEPALARGKVGDFPDLLACPNTNGLAAVQRLQGAELSCMCLTDVMYGATHCIGRTFR